jgi:hypothetical protein
MPFSNSLKLMFILQAFQFPILFKTYSGSSHTADIPYISLSTFPDINWSLPG